jgi:hypothetical protein
MNGAAISEFKLDFNTWRRLDSISGLNSVDKLRL